MTEIVKCYKTLRDSKTGLHAGAYGNGAYTLPEKRVGKWSPVVRQVELCVRGYHACLADQLVYHLSDIICPAELRGGVVYGKDKLAGQQIRLYPPFKTWNEQTRRLFACDCAERVEPVYRLWRNDTVVGDCIRLTRRFALDPTSTNREAWVAAAYAVGASMAAEGAAYAADAVSIAAGRAGLAAEGAGLAAAAAEREWQTARLWQYLNGEVDIEAIRRCVSA